MCLKARKCEVRVTVRVDVLMSRSKHTIPHAQSSPRVNLSIGAKQGRYRTGQEGVEPETRNRKTERKIKGCETPARKLVSENHFHPPIPILDAVTLIWDANHLHRRREELKMCVSHMKLGPPTDLSPACRVNPTVGLTDACKLFFFYLLCFGCRLKLHGDDTHQMEVVLGTNAPP